MTKEQRLREDLIRLGVITPPHFFQALPQEDPRRMAWEMRLLLGDINLASHTAIRRPSKEDK